MSITVAPEIVAELRPEATVLMHVRSGDAPERLADALRKAGADIAALDGGWQSAPGLSPGVRTGPKYVSEPVPVPDGQLLLIDLGDTPEDLLLAVPELIVRRLADAGVQDAVIRGPRKIGDRHLTVQAYGPAARASLRGPLGRPFGSAPRRPPLDLLDIASAWLRGQHQVGAELLGVVVSAEVPLRWHSLQPAVGAVLEANGTGAAMTSDFGTAAAGFAVAGTFHDVVPEASLTAAGAGWTAADVAVRMRGQRDTIRAHAEKLAWAGVTASADARFLLFPRWDDRVPPGQRTAGTPAAGAAVDLLSDVLVPDAAWYQVLSAGHLDRIGGPPAGAVDLGGGRVELTVGEPEQWVPGHADRGVVQARGRALLAACLADDDEARALAIQRMQQARQSDDSGFFPRV